MSGDACGEARVAVPGWRRARARCRSPTRYRVRQYFYIPYIMSVFCKCVLCGRGGGGRSGAPAGVKCRGSRVRGRGSEGRSRWRVAVARARAPYILSRSVLGLQTPGLPKNGGSLLLPLIYMLHHVCYFWNMFWIFGTNDRIYSCVKPYFEQLKNRVACTSTVTNFNGAKPRLRGGRCGGRGAGG